MATSAPPLAAQTVLSPCLDNPLCEFHFPFSDREPLTPEQLEGVPADVLWEARNEIFARKGFAFQTARARAHFSQKPYYQPATQEISLNAVEARNVNLIRQYEQTAGGSFSQAMAAPVYSEGTISGLESRDEASLPVNLGPGEEFTEVGRLADGDRVVIEHRYGQWVQVRYDDGGGWIDGEYVVEE